MYLRIINNDIVFPYDFRMLRNDFPNTSFPTKISDELCANYNMYRVHPTPIPSVEWDTDVVMGTPQYINGKYIQTWIIKDIEEWERDERISQQWDVVRGIRNQLLSESDWTQLQDVNLPNKLEWIEYRENLRNITNQTENPFDIIWPSKPQ
jgi:hypothetical protein